MEDSKGDSLGCLVGFLLLVPLPITLSYIEWFSEHPVIQIIVLAVFLITTTIYAYRLSLVKGLKIKTLSFVLLSLNLVFFYGILYFSIYLISPNSFRVTQEYARIIAIDEIGNIENEIDKNIKDRVLANILLNDSHKIHEASKNIESYQDGIYEITKWKANLSQGYTLSYFRSIAPPAVKSVEVMPPQVNTSLTLSNSQNSLSWPTIVFLQQPDDKKDLGRKILTHVVRKDKLQQVFLDYRKNLKEEEEMLLTKLEKFMAENGVLKLDHFLFYSLAMVTTIGSDDIAPNTSFARSMVSLQAFMSFVFFGFLITRLWPDIKDNLKNTQ